MDQAHFIYGLEDVDIQTADIWQTQERLKPVCPLHTDDPIIEHCTAPWEPTYCPLLPLWGTGDYLMTLYYHLWKIVGA